MGQFKYLIPKLADEKIVSTFVALAKEFEGGQFTGHTIYNHNFSVPVDGNFTPVTLPLPE